MIRGAYPRPSGAAAAKIRIAGKQIYLGTFEDVATAATAYDWACINQGVRKGLPSGIFVESCLVESMHL